MVDIVVVIVDAVGISVVVREGEVVLEGEDALGECGQFRGGPSWSGTTMSVGRNSGSSRGGGGGGRGLSCPLIH